MVSISDVQKRQVPRWAHLTAHAVPLAVLPSGLWRVALGLGVPVGFTGSMADEFAAPGWITPYVIVLTLLCEGLAFLTLGLVSPWGDRPPSWVPLVGGRTMNPRLVALAAATGGLAVTYLTWGAARTMSGPDNMGDPESPQGVAGVVMTACCVPFLLWGPLLLLVTADYWRRRCRR